MNSLILQLRSAIKNSLAYSIGIFSLTLGFAVCILVYRFIQSESQYDVAHDHSENLYRVILHNSPDGVDLGDAVVQFPMAPQLQSDYAGIESVLRIYREPDFPLVQFNDIKFTESRLLFVDPNFFSFFAFPLISGDSKTALGQPNSIVLTKRSAERYFGTDDVLGRSLRYQGKYSLVVTGVVDDTKILSHVKFDMLMPMEFYFGLLKERGDGDQIESWFNTRPWAYVKFKNKESKEIVDGNLNSFVDKHIPIEFKSQVTLELQPVTKIHTSSNYATEIEPNTSDAYLNIFFLIIVTILVFSSINFLNLNTSIVLTRAKEFSVKGILGSSKIDLFREIFVSTFRITLFSLILALALVVVLQPYLNFLMEVHVPSLSIANDWLVMSYALMAVITLSLISSLQPFIVIAAANYLNTINDKKGVSASVRKIAVGLQIACSFVLVFGTLIIFKQMTFLNSFDLGFRKENVIMLPFRQSVMDHFEAFKSEVKEIDGVVNVAWGANAPGLGGVTNYRFVPEGFRIDDPLFIPFVQIDYDFVETMGIKMKDGREFDPSIPGDSGKSYIVNQAFLESVGWTDHYIGKELKMYKPGEKYIGYSGKVIGSFYDFHMESLHFPEKPMILALRHTFTNPGSFLIRTEGSNADVIAALKTAWSKFENEWPFEYKLLDNELTRLYQNENKLFYLTMILSMLAITISLVGLFGMNSLAIVKQYKAIAIKKVLGAHADNISLEMLRKEFTFLAAVFVLAVPAGYYILKIWLRGFEYSVQISMTEIAESILLVCLLVLATIFYHLVKMRNTNPLHHIQKG
ncbi:MAG TPA: ABC transporter permease [Cyclobacteriaceae bacterium]|nr:ABC transporter permease [Cyclobacteriaceae bacterium]